MSTHFVKPLIAGECYHIYNRGNNSEQIFYKPENYRYFLRKYDKYFSDCLDTYAYNLLSNHFHFAVKVKEKSELIKLDDFIKIKDPNLFISERFRLFFMSYAKAINNQQSRTGSLFQKIFRRNQVKNKKHLKDLIAYIHHNPSHHNYKISDEEYPWSSFKSFLSIKETKLKRQEVLKLYGGIDEYLKYHKSNRRILLLEDMLMEDLIY